MNLWYKKLSYTVTLDIFLIIYNTRKQYSIKISLNGPDVDHVSAILKT
jgi:hypothetical protein